MSFVLAEGTYVSYAVYDSFDDSHIGTVDACAAWINCLETKANLVTVASTNRMKVYDIETKTLGSAIILARYEFPNSATLGWKFGESFLNTYMAVIDYATGALLIYKNGALLQTLTLTDLGFSDYGSRAISFSPRGKYIFIAGTLSASGNNGWVVLKGT